MAPSAARLAPPARELFSQWAHLSALSGLAYAQPVYDVFRSDPAALVAVDATGWALILLVAAIALAPPLLMTATEALARAVHRPLGYAVHLAFIGALVALFVLQARSSLGLTRPLSLMLALAAASLGTYLYHRSEPLRFGLSVLAPAPLVLAAIFISSSPVSSLVDPTEGEAPSVTTASGAPVVIVIFDEVPLPSLLDRRSRIDRERFPGLARLARDGTWFRSTASVDSETAFAVPAILTGRLSDANRLPIFSEHPQSLFTLLGATHEIQAAEPITRLCPPRLCPRGRGSAVATAWRAWNELSNFVVERLLPAPLDGAARRAGRSLRRLVGMNPRGSYLQVRADERVDDFQRLVRSIRRGRRPALYVLHTLTSHRPWDRLPSGARYRSEIHGTVEELRWRDNAILVAQGWQRHLLQLTYTDRLLQRLLPRLDREGLYDRSLIVAVADHGLNFALGGSLRKVGPETVAQLAPVPLVIKAPGQRQGRVSDAPLQTVDVLPTIADALDVRLPWRTDGRSGFEGSAVQVRRRRMFDAGHDPVTVPRARLPHGGESLARRLALFGSGDLRSLFTLGASRRLIGQRGSSGDIARDLSGAVHLDGADRFRQVRPESGEVPAEVSGKIGVSTVTGGRPLAIAMNGRIWAATRSFPDGGSERFTAILPEQAFRAGANDVSVLALRDGRGPPRIAVPRRR